MQASFLFCVAATIAFSQFLSVFGSSEFKLHNQHTGYFLESKSRTKIFTKRSNKIERKSGACLQDRQSKNINCQVINDDKAYIAFEFPQNLLGYQEFDILQYGDTTTGHSAAAESELLTMSNLTYYIIQQEEAEIAGVMDITVPPYGSIISNELYIEVDYHNVAHTSNFKTVARQEGLQFHFKVLGVTEGLYPGELRHLKSTNIEPGSWFYSVTPVQARQQNPSNKANQHYNDAELKRGYPSYGYIEFIMSEENIVRQRRYRDQYELNNEYSVGAASKHFLKARSMIDKPIAVQPGSEPQATLLGAGDKVNICIWSSNTMDGQKRIWLQQIEHLDTAQFRFTWMLTLTEGLTIADESARLGALKRQGLEEPTSMFTTVRRLFAERGNGRIMDSPFNGIALDVEDLLADPGDGRRPAAEIWAGDELELYRYAHESLILANYSIDHVQPQWCRQFYTILRDSLPPQRCSAIVYGNERDFSADVLVTDAAHILKIPTVAELLNLFVHPEVVPTLMIAPSTYAVEHESIQAILRSSSQNGTPRKAVAVVVPPSVDTDKFNPALFHQKSETGLNKQPHNHPKCQPLALSAAYGSPCVNIAFIARLAPEKNPGLFLQAAYEILQLHPFARFTVVGDGVLRTSLQDLAARLQISWAVHFAGWVSTEELPQLLAGVDIVVNPSLRAWSETFCISNIEVMSMEVPLVTFAVGGIGEYVQKPPPLQFTTTASSQSPPLPDYSVSSNAVVVNRASPAALASAVQHLILHPDLRRSLGRAGRRTVLSSFTITRQMEQYSSIYQSLHDSIL